MKNKRQSDILLIIPAFNEEECIERVVRNLIEHYPQFDYVIVNDGSTDDTSKIAHRCDFNVVDLPINLGLTGAFQTGMKYAAKNNYFCAIQFDADGQHKPEHIQELYESIRRGNDIAIGSRFVKHKKPFSMRMFGSRLIETAIRLTTGRHVKDPTSGMRMYSSNVIRKFANNVNLTPEPDTISYLLKTGSSVDEVQVEMDERLAGESYLTLSKSIRYMTLMLTSILFVQPFRARKN
ncbi:glycosyltransferase family 2 protein [Ileibacterium valens]|uniref:Glycosyl transferase family 2 n=2 Tax=Ileibacterium valens TaxID=1862668 RepID=A0A1U7NDU4_9FIRM|nr:glycosyltransferase family 2 protein [Ileibacterium valens]OLU37512.1 glycosyl transferase family 2 [Ileibacterium valens]OLU39360.1 glycosyl transferase family 2 [Erysipelotrichaceae bacterium NYU-BL-F16]OLU42065.1 glycosyl transferase family 2 [Erysipelotrichaceae bacterium NYU-BL-E8]